jgi:hypothetical protein
MGIWFLGWRKMDGRGCFVFGLSSGLLWLFLFPLALRLVLIPTFRCADFSRELWRELHGCSIDGVGIYPRMLLAVVDPLFLFSSTLVCTVLACVMAWRLHSARCCWHCERLFK